VHALIATDSNASDVMTKLIKEVSKFKQFTEYLMND